MNFTEACFFAVFIFLLLCALLFICRRFILLPKGKKLSADEGEKEERLFRLYQNMEEMMDNFEAYIEETRTQVDAARADMLKQEEKINELVRRAEATEAKALAAAAALRPSDKPMQKADAPHTAEAVRPVGDKTRAIGRQEAIRELLGKGLTVEQIAQKLELSINEVRLVVYGLMKKKE